MSTQDKPITTPAAMRAAEKIAAQVHNGQLMDDHAQVDRERLATIIDQQTHLPELVEAAEMFQAWHSKMFATGMPLCVNGKPIDHTALNDIHSKLRSVLERVKGEK